MAKTEIGALVNFIEAPKVVDDAFLFFVEGLHYLPFEIRRVYYIIKPKSGEPRGFHAHRETNQVFFCIQGSVKLVVDNGKERGFVVLKDQPEQGVLLPRLLWHEMLEMDESTILLVFADREFDPNDYIRDYSEFLRLTANAE